MENNNLDISSELDLSYDRDLFIMMTKLKKTIKIPKKIICNTEVPLSRKKESQKKRGKDTLSLHFNGKISDLKKNLQNNYFD